MFNFFPSKPAPAPQGPITADTPIAAVLERLFPKGMVMGEQRGVLVRACRFEHRYGATVRFSKIKNAPSSGTPLAESSTQGIFGRERWYLIECDEVYVTIRVAPTQKGCGFAEIAYCEGAAITDEEKLDWRQQFDKRMARMDLLLSV